MQRSCANLTQIPTPFQSISRFIYLFLWPYMKNSSNSAHTHTALPLFAVRLCLFETWVSAAAARRTCSECQSYRVRELFAGACFHSVRRQQVLHFPHSSSTIFPLGFSFFKDAATRDPQNNVEMWKALREKSHHTVNNMKNVCKQKLMCFYCYFQLTYEPLHTHTNTHTHSCYTCQHYVGQIINRFSSTKPPMPGASKLNVWKCK